MGTIKAFLRRHLLVRLLIVHTLIGFGLSALFVGGLVVFDAGGFATLIAHQQAWPFAILLWFFAGLTFASVQMGMAVMSLIDQGPGGGGKRQRTPRALAVAAARARP
ncbi:MAG: hypothetical protein R3C25_07250 [Hyphomonadaceae bacterium]